MPYAVRMHRSVRKRFDALPAKIQERFLYLVEVLRLDGPTGPHDWPNYGKLKGTGNRYHCHLGGGHAWVACWSHEKDTLNIEVYYVGSHQKAPY